MVKPPLEWLAVFSRNDLGFVVRGVVIGFSIAAPVGPIGVLCIRRSLAEGRRAVEGALAGGLNQWKTLHEGTPEAAVAETEDALAQTEGRGLIVAAGCVLPMETPDANVAAVVRRLGGPLKPVPGAVFR